MDLVCYRAGFHLGTDKDGEAVYWPFLVWAERDNIKTAAQITATVLRDMVRGSAHE